MTIQFSSKEVAAIRASLYKTADYFFTTSAELRDAGLRGASEDARTAADNAYKLAEKLKEVITLEGNS